MNRSVSPKKYEVRMVDFGTSVGSEQKGCRPAVIVQNDIGNTYSPTTIVCPITSKRKQLMPTHVILDPAFCGIKKPSTVMCEQIRVVDKSRVGKFLFTLSMPDLRYLLDQGLMLAFGIAQAQH